MRAMMIGAAMAVVAATGANAQLASVTKRIDGIDNVASAERPAMLRAAGFVPEGERILNKCGVRVDFSATNPPAVVIRDVNGDGRVEALLRDTGECYGPAGNYFAIITKDADGHWRQLLSGLGIVRMVTPGYQGWPDAEVQSAGACKPLWRWNGTAYKPIKTCKE